MTPDISQNFRDENGLGLIHWAADRGVVDIVRLVTAAQKPGEASTVTDSFLLPYARRQLKKLKAD